MSQKSVIRNATKLSDRRGIIINAFVNNHIQPRDVRKDVYYKPKESEPKIGESIAEGTKKTRIYCR